MHRPSLLRIAALTLTLGASPAWLMGAPISMNLENGVEPRFGFSAIHDGGSAVNIGGVTWRTGVGSGANYFTETALSGSWDENAQFLTIDSSELTMNAGTMDPRAASVTLSSAGLDFSVGADQFIGTIEYSIDYDSNDTIDDSGSFFFYNHNFPGAPNGVALDGETYEVSLWGNNWDNVNGSSPAEADMLGLDVRLTFTQPSSVPDTGTSLASLTLLILTMGGVGAKTRQMRQLS